MRPNGFGVLNCGWGTPSGGESCRPAAGRAATKLFVISLRQRKEKSVLSMGREGPAAASAGGDGGRIERAAGGGSSPGASGGAGRRRLPRGPGAPRRRGPPRADGGPDAEHGKIEGPAAAQLPVARPPPVRPGQADLRQELLRALGQVGDAVVAVEVLDGDLALPLGDRGPPARSGRSGSARSRPTARRGTAGSRAPPSRSSPSFFMQKSIACRHS